MQVESRRTSKATASLPGSRPEHAQNHRDLPGMVNRVLHDSVEQCFVGITAPRNLARQFLDGKSPDLSFQQVATLPPARDEVVPRNRRLGPFLFLLPAWHRIAVGGIPDS